MTSESPTLEGAVAIVTGASRGAGRGIAVELGARGATVVVTGRSTREQPAESYRRILELSSLAAMPGSIDQTAAEVDRAGGRGVAVRCDHSVEAEVAELFARCSAGVAEARAFIAGLSGGDWDRIGVHVVRGEIRMSGIMERMITGHLEEHANQLDRLAAEAGAAG